MGLLNVFYNEDLTDLAITTRRVAPTTISSGLKEFYFPMKSLAFAAVNAVDNTTGTATGAPVLTSKDMTTSVSNTVKGNFNVGVGAYTFAFVMKNASTAGAGSTFGTKDVAVANSYLFIEDLVSNAGIRLKTQRRDISTNALSQTLTPSLTKGVIGEYDMYVVRVDTSTGSLRLSRPKTGAFVEIINDPAIYSYVTLATVQPLYLGSSGLSAPSITTSLHAAWDRALTTTEISAFYKEMQRSLAMVALSI